MANDDVLTRNDEQELAVRVVSATEASAVVNPDDVFTRTDEGNLAVRVVGAGGGSGGGDVTSVNGKKGKVILTAEDVKATPQFEEMPDASANLGKVIQYVGEDGDYKKGSMYVAITKTIEGKIDLTWDGVGLKEATVNKDVFKSKVTEEGIYTFTLVNGNWTLNGQVVDLAQYGISVDVKRDYLIMQTAGTPNFVWWVQQPDELARMDFPNGVELETGEGYIIMVGDGRVYFYAGAAGTTRRKWESYYDAEGQPTETQVIYTQNEDWRNGTGMTYSDRQCREEYAPVTEFIDEIFGWHRLDYQKGITYDLGLENAYLDYQPDGVPEMFVEANPAGATVEITDEQTVYNEFFNGSPDWQRCDFTLVGENTWEDSIGRVFTADDFVNYGITIEGVGESGFSIVSTGFYIGSGIRIKIDEVTDIQDGSLVNIEYTKDSSVDEWKAISGGVDGIKWDKSVDLPAYTTETFFPLINLGQLPNGIYEFYFSKKNDFNGVFSDTILKFRFSVNNDTYVWELVKGFASRVFGIEGDLTSDMLPAYSKYFQIMRSEQDNNLYLGTDDATSWGTYINKEEIVKDCFRMTTIKNIETGEEYSGEIYGSVNNNRFYEIQAYAAQAGNIVLYASINIPDPVIGTGNNQITLDTNTVGVYLDWNGGIYNEAFNPDYFAEKTNIRVFAYSEDRQNILSAVIHTGANITCEIEAATGIFEGVKPLLYDRYNARQMYGNEIVFYKEGGFTENVTVYANVNWDALVNGRTSYLYPLQDWAYNPDMVIQEIPVISPSGGSVSSVNGKTGAVVLDGEDISADVDDLPNTIQGHLQSMSDKIKDIEMVKVPNATIVGYPEINHGQVSGFSSGDYLQFPFELDVQNRFLKVNFCFTTGEDVTTQQNILDSYYGLALAIANGKGLMAVSHNGTSWAFQTVGSMDILPNTTYFARLTWNGMLYKTELSTNHVDYTADMVTASTESPYKRTMFIGGSPDLFGVGSAHPFKGSINLNYANVEIDDNDIWEGMDDVGLGTRLDVNVSNISEEGKEKIKQIAGGLPDQTGNAGKFLITNGTEASWSDKPLVNLSTTNRALAIGRSATATGIDAIAINGSSYGGSATGIASIVIGTGSATALRAIQIGEGTNSERSTLCIGFADNNYKLLDSDGTIPAERLSNTIGDINSILDSINGEEI